MIAGPAPSAGLEGNPMGTDGFEFVEFAAPDCEPLHRLFRAMGFVAVARHRSKRVTLCRQGGVNFLVNAEPGSFAADFARRHGPCVCAMALRVGDAAAALRRAVSLGATEVPGRVGPMELNIPAIEGIGGSLIYLVDRWGKQAIYDIDFEPIRGRRHPKGAGLAAIDHLTHNVYRGHMDDWAGFYERIFGFREIRYFKIAGRQTGLRSRALVSPCGKIRIPINESADDRSQIAEYLRDYRGEGIQHIALATPDILASVDRLRRGGVTFLNVPNAYYDMLDGRLPGHGLDGEALRRRRVLADGGPGQGLLLQIFTETAVGPVFFELIERRGNDGFGEGNFQALFEAIERDQIRRGVLVQPEARP